MPTGAKPGLRPRGYRSKRVDLWLSSTTVQERESLSEVGRVKFRSRAVGDRAYRKEHEKWYDDYEHTCYTSSPPCDLRWDLFSRSPLLFVSRTLTCRALNCRSAKERRGDPMWTWQGTLFRCGLDESKNARYRVPSGLEKATIDSYVFAGLFGAFGVFGLCLRGGFLCLHCCQGR